MLGAFSRKKNGGVGCDTGHEWGNWGKKLTKET